MALGLLWSSKYYCNPDLRMISVQEICLRISNCNMAGEKTKTYQVKRFGGTACRGCCFSLPLLMNAEVICLSEEESRREAWFPLHFICAPQPLPVSPPVLSHAGVPQEAALHEGQRSGKERKPLVLSFTTKPTNTQRHSSDFYCTASFGCLAKYTIWHLRNMMIK